jgi:hypothetical protein
MKNGKKMSVDNPDDLFHLGVTDIDYGELGYKILQSVHLLPVKSPGILRFMKSEAAIDT